MSAARRTRSRHTDAGWYLAFGVFAALVAFTGLPLARVSAQGTPTTVNLANYVRVGRFDLPEPTRTTPPNGTSLLAQEASAVTYNWDTDTLFVVGDGGTSVVQVSKTGALIDSMTLAPGSSPQGTEFYDTEGITYIGFGQFVMTEERDRQLVEFTYAAGTTLTRANAKTVKLGTTIGNIGLEGVSFDPKTGQFIVVKEKDPRSIFQTGVDFVAGTATNGSPTTVNSTDLFDPALVNVLDFSDIFALSNLPALGGTPEYDQLLVISQESGQIVQVDRSGTVHHTLTIVADPGSPLSVPDMTMEGVTMDRDGKLYVVNENGGGDANHPQLWVYAPSLVPNTAPTAVSLIGAATSIPQNTNTAAAVKLADILVTDDGLGDNNLSVSGTDANSFEIVGTALLLKAGTILNAATKPSYSIAVNVDDPTVGGSPDASTPYTLTITTASGGSVNLAITEVAPWSSGNSPASLAADWFEVTNFGIDPVSLVGWTMDDNSNSFSVSVPLNGITSIAPGESVIFIETATSGDLPAKKTAFIDLWFGGTVPAGLQIGSYSGSGVGLSTGGDAVNLFDNAGTVQANISFPAVPPGSTFFTFDNTAGLNNALISNLSIVGLYGAFVAVNDANEIGSPGTIGSGAAPIINITAPDANASETGSDPGTFHITRSGSVVSPLTVNYTIATGAGQATAGDYTPTLTGSVTIAAGSSFVDIIITPVDDALVEGPETLTLTLFDTGSYDVGSPASATVTIADNDVLNLPPTAVVLSNTVSTLSEATSTASAVRVADISITDDGVGVNALSLSGTDAAFFQITGSSLFLKAGTVLSHATKPSYNVTVNVDDPTVGTSPDATANFTLTITASVAPGTIVISEVAPWSSSNSPLAADWFEVTNTSHVPVDITGWKMDDNSHSISNAIALNGITSIGPGEAVIFIETADLPTTAAAFRTFWFGANPPAGLQIGSYSGSGVGLSGSGDEVALFDAAGNLVTGVGFTASPTTAPFKTFDNHNGVGGTTIPLPAFSTLSTVGVNGAFPAVNDANEIGSPGVGNVGRLIISEVAPWGSSISSYLADWFEVTNVGSAAVDITGWKMDDNSNAFANAVALNGVTSVASGQSVVFMETATPATTISAFEAAWFGSNAPSGFTIGSYTGSGVGLSTTADAVNLFDSAGNRITGVNFGASTTNFSFDNTAGLGSTALPLPTISTLSVAGINRAFLAADGLETGSPGLAFLTKSTSTALISSFNPSVAGQSLTFTATVTPTAGGTPTGTVKFLDGATSLGTGSLNGSGVALFMTSSLAVGSHSITAQYGGDLSFSTSTSSPALAQVVNKAATSTVVAPSTNPSVAGQSVTLTATVSVTAPGAGIPTGTVTFLDGATSLGTGGLNGSGVAILMTSSLAAGSHSITASYAGDAGYISSTSAAFTQVVLIASSTALGSSLNPSIVGQSVTLTATVTGGTPTGTVTFLDGATSLGTGVLTAGQATLATASLSKGTHSVTAQYGGDANVAGSTSSPALAQVVNGKVSATAMTSSLNPQVAGQSVTFTATVTSTAGGTPTGNVNFFNGANAIGAGALNTNGVATFTITTLPVGAQSITAGYAGDPNYATSTSTALTETVNVAGFAPVSTAPTVVAGQSTVIPITVYAATGSNLIFTMSCTGVPMKSSCSFSVNPVTALPPPNGTPINLTFQTSSSDLPATPSSRGPWSWDLRGLYAVLALLLAAGMIQFRIIPRRRLAFGMCVVVVVLAAVLVGCSTGESTYTGTPKGAATFTVTATSGTTTISTPVSVTVQ